MTTFGQEMRELAVELTEEFSEDIGESTIIHNTGSVYDTDTGENVTTTEQESMAVTFTAIKASEVADISFRLEHEKAIVAGDNVTFVPAIDDNVLKPGGTTHRIAKVRKDMYSAAYVMYIEKNAT